MFLLCVCFAVNKGNVVDRPSHEATEEGGPSPPTLCQAIDGRRLGVIGRKKCASRASSEIEGSDRRTDNVQADTDRHTDTPFRISLFADPR